ncbi:outer membrane protein assembly factor BamD [Desulfoluna spongiiphila]|uniref:Beta-barrel assembly machine subunit BamD n=1 Tax=Desulfoluna spongiiphila TaxID=419481 RepID=A0A1G5INV1_9BACT|nr:outer membrane protein assembly factor BamD [Desulfoluna spongiiphila]SCY77805.1 Beta-barrel assembly machine subunit BamD [Desulfoluna spongiiphila]VVS92595.1 outer membrane protein assembly factor bamd [Desulfoluna spongiiphila]
MKRLISLALIALTALTLVSCGPKNKEEKLAPELAEDARVQFEKERYDEAIKIYTKLRDWYPFDKLAIEAEYNIAEAHFNMEAYDEAALAYEEFEKLHPRHESIDYIINQQALCYFNRLDTVDRDQAQAIKAISIFTRLIRQYPDSAYVEKAKEKRELCLKSLAGHEMYVGRFYLKNKKYESALHRFQTVIDAYAGLGFDEEAQELAARSREKLAEEKAEGAE